jgi:hypothetical protein
MDTLIDLTTRDEFRDGLLMGGVGAATILLTGLVWKGRPLPIWGITAVAAVWLAIWTTIGWLPDLAFGWVILAAAGWLWDRSKPGAGLLVLIGAAVIAWRGGLPDILWIRFGSVAAIFIIGIALMRFQRTDGLGHLTVPLLAITSVGIWATVPDTEEARVLLGVLVLMGLVAWPWRLASVGAAGAFALAGLLVWIAAVGGAAREGSIIGAWASTGLILWATVPRLAARLRPIGAVLVHVVLVLVSARVAGLNESAPVAALIALPVAAVFIAGLWMSHEATATESDLPSHPT